MVEESFGIYVTRNSVGGSKKRRYAWQETLYMITSSLLFLSISCKVAFSPLCMHIHILPSLPSFVRHLLNFVSSLRFTGDFHEIEKPTKMEGWKIDAFSGFFLDYFRRGRSPSPASHDEYDEPEHAAAERLLERGKYLINVNKPLQ